MAKLTGQWKRLANKDLILCRRRFWLFFLKFESFRNHIHRLEVKLNKQAATLQKTYDERAALMKKGNQILREIDESRESDPDVTAPAMHEFPLFKWRVRDVAKPVDDWSHFENVLKHGDGGIAGLADIKGIKIGGQKADTFMMDDASKEYNDDYHQESTGSMSTPIHTYGKQGNQKGKQRNN